MAGIYIHIPFCKQACHYCNFHFATSHRYKKELIQALPIELELHKAYLGPDATIETIYFGGGTPSLLTQTETMSIFDAVFKHYHTDLREVTFEANPDDLTVDYLEALSETPVNRLSIGVQSFFEEDLRWMNRAHTQQQAENCIRMAMDTGFNHLTIDLIYGAPTTTDAMWQHNMQKAIELGIEHISAYALTVEDKTPLSKMIRTGQAQTVNADKSATQFVMMVKTLTEAGFEQYEISNFAKNRQYALHNTSYWQGVHYLGIGPSAHSYDGRSRCWNIANNRQYIKSVVNGIIPAESELLTTADRFNELIMTGLRTMWGVSLQALEQLDSSYATLFQQNIQKYISAGQMKLESGSCILTQEGKILADGIASDLFVLT